ncbi:MAG: hypothetical protein FJ280_11665 [Planctomycetes bacterium]|nr:hypothetical protein [Planctomycetota bacterium]
MKSVCLMVSIVTTVGLFAGAGCNDTTGKNPETNLEFRQVKASLEESQQRSGLLEKDVERLKTSLGDAESKLADTTKARNNFQQQVQDLTVSRTSLEAKVDELDKARTSLETRVGDLTKSRDDLQKTVESLSATRGVLERQVADLTKARNAALDDARVAQTKVDALNDRVKAQTQQMIELQDQIKTIRAVLEQLQQKLE